MYKTFFLVFIYSSQLICNQLISIELFRNHFDSKLQPCCLVEWQSSIILASTPKKTARTAVLIIAPPKIRTGGVESRWKLGKKVWELYMNSHPNVDCYFVQSTYPRKELLEQVWIEGNTIYIGDTWYEQHQQDRILFKTIKALELLIPQKYTHFIRTNLNTFINLNTTNDYMKKHQQSFYTTPLWEGQWFTIGYGIIFTVDVAKHILKEYLRIEKTNNEFVSSEQADDYILTALATGVWPLNEIHPFICCSKLTYGIRQLMCKRSFDTTRIGRYGVLLNPINSLEEAISYIDQAGDKVILYRSRDGLSLEQIAKLYEYLIKKIYPKLPYVDLVKFIDENDESI